MNHSMVAIPGLSIPPKYAKLSVGDLTHEQLLEILETAGEGGIRISFAGKSNARRLARAVRPRATKVIGKYGIGSPEERSVNCLVEGDNLQAMATLYKERGQVDLILTDPPYNTGKDFRYNDKWDNDPNDPGLGDFVTAEDGARHTKWMKFMWPRLQIMKSMLKPTGVIAICIDHRELFRLGQMMDELFGEQNRLAIINWQRSATRRNDKGAADGSGGVSTATEYVLVYARDKTKSTTCLETRTNQQDYKNPDNDPKGEWNGVAPWAPGASTHKGMVYAVQSPFTGKLHYPPGNQCWAYEKKTIHQWIEVWGSKYEERDLSDGCVSGLVIKGIEDPKTCTEGDPVVRHAKELAERVGGGVLPVLYFSNKGYGRPRKKTYLDEIKNGMVPTTFWAGSSFDFPVDLGTVSWAQSASGSSEAGSRELTSVVGNSHGFETVKPLRLFQKIIQLWCPVDGLILDPFGGSGTTGHAVFDLNESTGTGRRFTIIEQGRPENGDSYARTLLADRLRRVVSGDWAAGKRRAIAGGFTFISLGKKVDASMLLRMERDEMVDTVIASHFDASRRSGDQLVRLESEDNRYLVARNADNEGFFLVWDGPNKNTDFTEAVYEACADEAEKAGLKTSPYNVYARLYLYQTEGVHFLQIPDRILADFGLDLRSEPFAENEEEA